jgi:hypothetical protein
VKITARGAQERRPRKRSFSRDDRLARDGARMHTGSNSLSAMQSSPPPPRVANNDRFMLPARIRCVCTVWGHGRGIRRVSFGRERAGLNGRWLSLLSVLVWQLGRVVVAIRH